MIWNDGMHYPSAFMHSIAVIYSRFPGWIDLLLPCRLEHITTIAVEIIPIMKLVLLNL